MNYFRSIHLIVLYLNINLRYADSYDQITATTLNTNKTSLTRISGGNPASVNQFPWHVLIQAFADGEVSSCGGSILSTKWILTAAHCTYDYLTLDLYFGAIDIYSIDEIQTSTYWIEHSDYDPSTYNNDISVVQLPSALPFSKSIQPISLVSVGDVENDFVNKVAIILGFGYTDDVNRNESEVLLYTKVKIVPNPNCTEHYGTDVVTESTLCAVGHKAPINSICSGDSGGAMVIPNETGGYVQIGINSFVSTSGCTTGKPSGYVRVDKFLEWISESTRLRVLCKK